MITIRNYTRDNEQAASTVEQLEGYYDSHEDEETIYTIDAIDMTGYDNCLEWLELDEAKQDLAEAIAEHVGGNYFDNISDLLGEWDNIGLTVIEDVSSDYELAKYLMYDNNSDEELLYGILGCSAEAYEQLGSYINTDDLASTIDVECNVRYVNGKAYMFVD